MNYTADRSITPVSEKELDAFRSQVIEKLSTTPVSADVLIEQCEASAAAVAGILLELELAGKLRRAPGNKVYLTEVIVTEEVA